MSEEKSQAQSAGSGGAGGRIMGLVLPALCAAAAAFGGAKVAVAHHATAAASASEQKEAAKPPGPTLALDAFVLTVPDATKRARPMKVSIAVEFASGAGEELLKELTPRIRDATLGYLRTLTYEDVIDPAASDRMKSELLERLRAGGTSAERILITDLVIQ